MMIRSVVAGQKVPFRAIMVALLVAMMGAFLVLGLVTGRLAHATTTFTVNNTGNENDLDFPGGTFDGSSDGLCDTDAAAGEQCTLRAAIQEANVTAGADTINFNILATSDSGCESGSGVCTISPDFLTVISEEVTIDGYTQPGSHPNTLAKGNDAVLKIELAGTNAGVTDGLEVRASNSVVRGLVINDFDKGGAGLSVAGDNNKIEGNFIGTDPTGTSDVGNSFGVSIRGTNNTLGGTSPEARNLISGNLESGVRLEALTTSTKVLGNYIGTKRDGRGILANHFGSGVLILNASNNTIGDGTAAGANRIEFNGNDGVSVSIPGISATGNRILRNVMFFNEELGIDLGDDGPTPNDPQDTDSGPNTLQNKPTLSSATTTGSQITITGTLRSTPNSNFTIRFFSSHFGNEGERFLGQKSVTTDASGKASFTRVLGDRVPAGERITATATDPGGNTSEFSAVRLVVQQ
jgi:CSLREA domain-containing protein